MEKEQENEIVVWLDREPQQTQDGVEYYNAPCMVHIRVQDEKFNRDGILVTWDTKTEVENAIEKQMANQWKENWWICEEETGAYEKEYLADQDGRYYCSVEYTNGKGQVFLKKGPHFVVDQTKPNMSVEKIGRENGEEQEFLLEVEECNFSQDRTSVSVKERTNGREEWKTMDPSWVRVGDSALSQIHATGENVEGIFIQSEDLSGNKGEYYYSVPEMKMDGEGEVGLFFSSMVVLFCFFLLTVFTGVRKIFL